MRKTTCALCEDSRPLDFDFTFAFQPIVDVPNRRILGYEALVRGLNAEPASWVLSHLTPDNRYQFDQTARTKAIALAARLFPRHAGYRLSLNILPNAIYDPERCIRTTLQAAKANDFPVSALMFEMTEQEPIADVAHLQRVVAHYKSLGFTTAIDDFGAGFAGLGFLTTFTPNILKLDRELIRGIDASPVRQAILSGILGTTRALDIAVVAEGVETQEELAHLLDRGIALFQGFLLARPGFESLPRVDFAALGLDASEVTPHLGASA